MKKQILSNFTILYVEDDLNTQEFIGLILKKYFKNTYIASNGQEGLELFNKNNPDIVLSDIVMPIMNGLTMCKQIKEIKPHQPIAIFTAFEEHDYLMEAINMGLDKYIAKPFNTQLFFKALLSIAKVLQADINKEHFEHLVEVQSKVNAMGEMLNNISHQWKQPLSAITTAASAILISKEFKLCNDINENDMLTTIVEQSQALGHTIDNFRDFTKGNYNINKNGIDIKELFVKINNIIGKSYQNHSITIVPNIQSCIIYQDQNQLIQIFLNILNNTKDAFVLNDISKSRLLFIDIKIDNDNLYITFQDNAGGIDQKIIDKVFEPFFTTKHQYYGTGVGLYITHKIVTKYLKGEVTIYNKQFNYKDNNYYGATLEIRFPIKC